MLDRLLPGHLPRLLTRLPARFLASALAAGLLLAGAPAGAAETPGHYAPTTGALFNNPLGGEAGQRRLFTHVIRTINSTPPGGAIRIAVFSFSDRRTADALLAAYHRGVRVKLVFSGNEVYAPMTRLRSEIGSNPDARSFVVICQDSCRGTAGQMHAKYFAFSGTTGGSRHITMVGSNNMTNHNAQDQWSDLYTVAGDKRYYRAYANWFSQLKHDRPVAKTYLRRFVGLNRIAITPVDLRTEEDPIREAMSRIHCEVTRGEIDPKAANPDKIVRTRIRIGAHAWNGERGKAIARDVAALARDNCLIQVFYGVGTGPAVRAILDQAGVKLSNGTHKGIHTHEKLMIVDGSVGKEPATIRVLTGSHNWSDRSPVRDDVIVTTRNLEVGKEYIKAFRYMWTNG